MYEPKCYCSVIEGYRRSGRPVPKIFCGIDNPNPKDCENHGVCQGGFCIYFRMVDPCCRAPADYKCKQREHLPGWRNCLTENGLCEYLTTEGVDARAQTMYESLTASDTIRKMSGVPSHGCSSGSCSCQTPEIKVDVSGAGASLQSLNIPITNITVNLNISISGKPDASRCAAPVTMPKDGVWFFALDVGGKGTIARPEKSVGTANPPKKESGSRPARKPVSKPKGTTTKSGTGGPIRKRSSGAGSG
jgi:hypothetical protein